MSRILTALQLQGAGLRIQREAAEVHVTGCCHGYSVPQQKHIYTVIYTYNIKMVMSLQRIINIT